MVVVQSDLIVLFCLTMFDSFYMFNAMRTMLTKKSKMTPAKRTVPATVATPTATTPASASSSGSPGIFSHGPNGAITVLPPPEALLREAEEEPNYRELDEILQPPLRPYGGRDLVIGKLLTG